MSMIPTFFKPAAMVSAPVSVLQAISSFQPVAVVGEVRAGATTGGATDHHSGAAFGRSDAIDAPAFLARASADDAAVEDLKPAAEATAAAIGLEERLAAEIATAVAADTLGPAAAHGGGATDGDRERSRWPIAAGTPVTAPAVRIDFSGGAEPAQQVGRTSPPRREWRLADVVSALSGPSAAMLIAAADRPGPVEPGSLLEAVKVFRGVIPAPAPSTDAVV